MAKRHQWRDVQYFLAGAGLVLLVLVVTPVGAAVVEGVTGDAGTSATTVPAEQFPTTIQPQQSREDSRQNFGGGFGGGSMNGGFGGGQNMGQGMGGHGIGGGDPGMGGQGQNMGGGPGMGGQNMGPGGFGGGQNMGHGMGGQNFRGGPKMSKQFLQTAKKFEKNIKKVDTAASKLGACRPDKKGKACLRKVISSAIAACRPSGPVPGDIMESIMETCQELMEGTSDLRYADAEDLPEIIENVSTGIASLREAILEAIDELTSLAADEEEMEMEQDFGGDMGGGFGGGGNFGGGGGFGGGQNMGGQSMGGGFGGGGNFGGGGGFSF